MEYERHENMPRSVTKRPLLALSLLNLDMSALEAYADQLLRTERIRMVKEQDIVSAAENELTMPFRAENRYREEPAGDRSFRE